MRSIVNYQNGLSAFHSTHLHNWFCHVTIHRRVQTKGKVRHPSDAEVSVRASNEDWIESYITEEKQYITDKVGRLQRCALLRQDEKKVGDQAVQRE